MAQIVGTVAKHELGRVGWPELLAFIEQYTRSEDPKQREVGKRWINSTKFCTGTIFAILTIFCDWSECIDIIFILMHKLTFQI